MEGTLQPEATVLFCSAKTCVLGVWCFSNVLALKSLRFLLEITIITKIGRSFIVSMHKDDFFSVGYCWFWCPLDSCTYGTEVVDTPLEGARLC